MRGDRVLRSGCTSADRRRRRQPLPFSDVLPSPTSSAQRSPWSGPGLRGEQGSWSGSRLCRCQGGGGGAFGRWRFDERSWLRHPRDKDDSLSAPRTLLPPQPNPSSQTNWGGLAVRRAEHVRLGERKEGHRGTSEPRGRADRANHPCSCARRFPLTPSLRSPNRTDSTLYDAPPPQFVCELGSARRRGEVSWC